MIALQNLNATQNDMAVTQNRVNTGLKVASAKDNGAIWQIAQTMRGNAKSLDSVRDSLQRAQSTSDVALSAGDSVADLLLQMKEKALAASDTSLDTTSRTALNNDFKALRDQVTKVVANASFNNVNLINSGASNMAALADASGTNKMTVQAQNLSLGGSIVTIAAAGSIGTSTLASTMLTTVNTSIANVNTAMATMGTQNKALANHLTFVNKLQDSLTAGVGNLVDADLAKESARLTALQTKQQLGVQALSISNSSTSMILSLFQ
jgi:flagellin